MSHQDTDGHTLSAPHHQDLKTVLDWLLSLAQFSEVRFRQECSWTPKGLIFAALLWAWSDEKTLTERFFLARKVVAMMAILPRIPATTYQAFLKMLKTWTATLTVALIAAFRQRMSQDLAARFKVYGYSVFGVDGSRIELPRTESNEQRFSPSKAQRKTQSRGHSQAARSREKKSNSPQMWLTTMFHLGTGLPWDWRTGPSNSSEREHLRQMIDALPADALVTADAGFVGYECWKAVLQSGRHLLIRVGSNVRLLRKLGYIKETDGVVYLWPDREAARKQPPLVLRLIVAHDGKHPVYLVTSVQDKKRLSHTQVVEIYALRWGVELFYRHFKQTYECHKLRSHCGQNAELEAIWSLLGLWAMGLYAQVELLRLEVPPRRISVAGVLRAYRRAMREYKTHPDPGESLREMLAEAIIDDYERTNKASRDYPRKKQARPIGAPKIHRATNAQIKAAREISNHSRQG